MAKVGCTISSLVGLVQTSFAECCGLRTGSSWGRAGVVPIFSTGAEFTVAAWTFVGCKRSADNAHSGDCKRQFAQLIKLEFCILSFYKLIMNLLSSIKSVMSILRFGKIPSYILYLFPDLGICKINAGLGTVFSFSSCKIKLCSKSC